MLTFKDEVLSSTYNLFQDCPQTIDLTTDTEAYHYLTVCFGNTITRTIVLKPLKADRYQGTLYIYPEELPFLATEVSFRIDIVSNGFYKQSNTIPIKFDTDKIRPLVKNNEYMRCTQCIREIYALKERLEHTLSGNTLKSIPLVKKSNIKPGMVPVAIDTHGNFVATFPFADVVKSINNVKPNSFAEEQGNIRLTTADIPHKEQSLEKQIHKLEKDIVTLAKAHKELTAVLKQTLKELKEYKIKQETLPYTDVIGG